MNTADWCREDIDALHEMVMEALAAGRGREEAFKRFAREKGIKSVNAVRYKWITTSPSPAELTGEIELLPSKFRSKKSDPQTSAPPFSDSECSTGKADDLKEELNRVKSMIAKLRDKNTRLRRENRQLTNNLQAVLSRSNVDKPQVVVVVGADGWKPESLAKFIQYTQTEGEWAEAGPLKVHNLQA